MIYLDTSALVKLVRAEVESAALIAWLGTQAGQPLVSSALAEVELPRALRRSEPRVLAGAPAVLARVYRVEIDATIRATAGGYPSSDLRSLDAIHLATAQVLTSASRPLTDFVAYDKRLLQAAADLGLPVRAPGVG